MNTRVLCLLLLGIIISSLLLSCAQENRGQLIRMGEVADQFAEATMIPGYTYYFYGRETSPIAIIALKQDLELVSRLWTPLADSNRSLEYLIQGTRKQRNDMCTFFGAVIQMPDGEPAGYWYSKWELTSIRTPEPGKIVVFPPAEPTSGPCRPEGFYRE